MSDSISTIAGQLFGLVSLLLCLLAFASKRDERLMALLLLANVAFALQFAFFGSWTAAALSLVVMARIVLARRYPGNRAVMSAVLAVSVMVALLTWQGWADLPALVAMGIGTVGMFLLKGIAMRVFLMLAAVGWMLSHLLAGSVGGSVAEGLIIVTSVVTIYRLVRARRRYPQAFE